MGTIYKNSIQYSSDTSDTAPIGCVLPYASDSIPLGWLLCDGRAVSRTDYALLFTVIGTKYGEGDGSTTFNIPDLIGRFPQGADGNLGSKVEAGIPNLTGSFQIHGGENGSMIWKTTGNSWYGSGGQSNQYIQGNDFTKTTGASSLLKVNFDASTASSVYNDSETVQPPATEVNYIIKYTYVNKMFLEGAKIDDTKTTNSNVWSADKVNNTFVPLTRTINDKDLTEDIELTASDVGAMTDDNSSGYFNVRGTTTVIVPNSIGAYSSFFACGVSANVGSWLGYGRVSGSSVSWTSLSGSGVSVSYSSSTGLSFSNTSSGYAIRVRGIYCPHP